jgi:hypothetical protein
MNKYATTHLPAEEIDQLRLKAFKTNLYADKMDYYKAASLYFQERHEREMNRALDLAKVDAKVDALVAAAEMMVKAYREDNDQTITSFYTLEDALAAMKGGDT